MLSNILALACLVMHCNAFTMPGPGRGGLVHVRSLVHARSNVRAGFPIRRSALCLRMGFLGWDFGPENAGKGIREILGIISCEASHILLKGPGSFERCQELKEEISDRISIPMGIGIEDAFSEVAKEYSQCPSAKDGGNLGVFKPGQMVPEFDRAAFSSGIMSVAGPVQTKFGHHLILVKRRTGDAEAKKSGCG